MLWGGCYWEPCFTGEEIEANNLPTSHARAPPKSTLWSFRMSPIYWISPTALLVLNASAQLLFGIPPWSYWISVSPPGSLFHLKGVHALQGSRHGRAETTLLGFRRTCSFPDWTTFACVILGHSEPLRSHFQWELFWSSQEITYMKSKL